jgi:hypothetical protein
MAMVRAATFVLAGWSLAIFGKFLNYIFIYVINVFKILRHEEMAEWR